MTIALEEATRLIKNARHLTAFTGAGISVESGIPPFRGENGLWSKYDPQILDLTFFFQNPKASWSVIKEIFYDFFGKAEPNDAHKGLARLEAHGLVKEIITQNIDNLHQEAGSKVIHEFHGNSQKIICTSCQKTFPASGVNLKKLPPLCLECNSLLKPDFIFFGEGIPQHAYQASILAAEKSDVFILIGTTGEIMPACQIPMIAKQSGTKIIEINPEVSKFTSTITDVFLKEKASVVMNQIIKSLELQDEK